MKITFKVNYHTRWGQNLFILGSVPELGMWHIEKAFPMNYVENGDWSATIDLPVSEDPLMYIYCVQENGVSTIYECGYPHTVECRSVSKEIVCDDVWQDKNTFRFFRDKPAKWRAAGVAIPVFSLRSQNSGGIGEFLDLKLMIDWARQTGQELIQVLPVNDTTMTRSMRDSYPYNAISIYALHPLYLNLEKMGLLDDLLQRDRFKMEMARLNAFDTLQYEEVDKLKWEYFRLIYAQEGEKTLQSPAYLWFFDHHKEWLIPYALYSYFRDFYHTADFRQWGEHAVYSKERAEKWLGKERIEQAVGFYCYLQFHLSMQLREVHDYAQSNGVLLKGDIPIGISRDSVEAWTEPDYFHLDSQTGAPPDDFSVTGQNWGFPTYNWERMAMDGYAWWKKRFENMAEYFDAYRIDHILGFFRIWEIPEHSVEGLLGHFSPAMPMSKAEIETYGLAFDEERMVQPYITEDVLCEVCGNDAAEIAFCFLERRGNCYRLKKQFATQRQIKAELGECNETKSAAICRMLFTLVNNVLFIEDPNVAGKYHPRIACYQTTSFKALTNREQEIMARIHNDFYYVRHDDFWRAEALKKLPPLLSATDMLSCGEDLGMIPACVPEVMQILQILSLEIQRMPKEFGVEFGDTTRYPYRSVCTTSTHDMSGLRGWWKENREISQHYYNGVLHREGEAPEELSGELCEQIVANHLMSPAMLAVFPWQDWLAIDEALRRKDYAAERINVPSDPHNNWNYRMHMTLEQLLGAVRLNTRIAKLIKSSGRYLYEKE